MENPDASPFAPRRLLALRLPFCSVAANSRSNSAPFATLYSLPLLVGRFEG
ncbi:MAG: hypothetical protein THHGLFOP_001355 [Candidatus Fervidibacter sp.]